MADRAEPRLLLTHSARSWVQDLHFHLIDHGGALVHGYALSAEEAVTASVDVLVGDDVCSFLSKRLVSDLRHRGVSVIGVFDPEDGEAGTGRLAEVGIDVHLPSDAPMETFVAGVVPAGRPIGAAGRSPRPERRQGASLAHPVVAVAAAGGGAGATEIALAMARRMGEKGRQVVLADADEVTPSIAQRLRLPLYPNIRTAADAICRDGDGIEDSLIEVAARTKVLVGLPNARLWHELRPTEVASVVADAATLATVVVNVGSSIEDVPTLGGPARFGIARSMIEAADAIVLVATSSPVGVARIVHWLASADKLVGDSDLHLVLNRFPRGGYRFGRIREELDRFASPEPITQVPIDGSVDRAAWKGVEVGAGRFRRAVARLTRHVERTGAGR